MATTNLGDYKNLYMQTAKEYVSNMFESIRNLENNPKDQDAINNLHIASHSLKSQSQVMGFTDIASTSFSIEKTSNDALNGAGLVDDKFIAFLNQSVGEVSLKLTQIEKGEQTL